ncbi:unnamed protein product [Acanthoscelides obtectus]|uniref:Reverse transcriptase domain-containing protein n=1 Tax=Acanthoscelides obtectus TaxID=200917 RepID=A0A9P0MF22_ACAOB|nr:unnamed protein product [Acanthoscelides obtectus]CAK1637279.1 RNA-directed DNA polymerase from mobile element jockey [Acanthoscelides obtectus]
MRETLTFLTELHKDDVTLVSTDCLKQFKYSYRQEIVKAKIKANDDYINKSNNRQHAAWNIIKNVKPYAHNQDSSTSLTAHQFNDFFTHRPQKLLNKITPSDVSPSHYMNHPTHSSHFREVSYHDVRTAINKLKNSKSTDPYGFTVRIVKTLQNLIIYPLTKLFNQCIESNTFPDFFKLSKIIPIFKQGDTEELCNYRPISLIPIFAKILELLLKDQINEYFEANNLFCSTQFGFRKNSSTTSAINSFIQFVNQTFENNLYGAACLLDLSKAFDCVQHDILLEKLPFYNFHD